MLRRLTSAAEIGPSLSRAARMAILGLGHAHRTGDANVRARAVDWLTEAHALMDDQAAA